MISRYDKASDAARRLLEEFDEFDLAEMLASSNTSAATLNARITELEQADAAIERVRAVHRVSTLHDVTPGQAAYCVNCRFAWPCPTTDALGQPQQSTLRDRFAAAIYEWNNPGHRWAAAHPDDLVAYRGDADAAMAVLPEQQRPPTGLPAEQPCADPRHTGALREQLGCSGPDPAAT